MATYQANITDTAAGYADTYVARKWNADDDATARRYFARLVAELVEDTREVHRANGWTMAATLQGPGGAIVDHADIA